METKIVAIRGAKDISDNVIVLPPSFSTCNNQAKVIIHHDPVIEFTPLGCNCNFDLLVDFCIHNPDSLLQTALKEKYVPVVRDKKDVQFIKINSMTDFRTPSTYIRTGMYSNNALAHLQCRVPDDYSVVKPNDGAGGCNQALVPNYLLGVFLDNAQLPISQLREMFPNVVFTQDVFNTDRFLLGPDLNDLVIQDYVKDVVAEYRILFGGDTIIGYKRTIHGDVYKQANIPIGQVVDEIKLLPLRRLFMDGGYDTKWVSKLEKNIQNLISNLNLHIGSIDLYVTSNSVGIFEYCNQFAFKCIDPGIIINLHKAAIEKMLEDSGV